MPGNNRRGRYPAPMATRHVKNWMNRFAGNVLCIWTTAEPKTRGHALPGAPASSKRSRVDPTSRRQTLLPFIERFHGLSKAKICSFFRKSGPTQHFPGNERPSGQRTPTLSMKMKRDRVVQGVCMVPFHFQRQHVRVPSWRGVRPRQGWGALFLEKHENRVVQLHSSRRKGANSSTKSLHIH
jgi:hypothetical protein